MIIFSYITIKVFPSVLSLVLSSFFPLVFFNVFLFHSAAREYISRAGHLLFEYGAVVSGVEYEIP
jgi:hypothetical protein